MPSIYRLHVDWLVAAHGDVTAQLVMTLINCLFAIANASRQFQESLAIRTENLALLEQLAAEEWPSSTHSARRANESKSDSSLPRAMTCVETTDVLRVQFDRLLDLSKFDAEPTGFASISRTRSAAGVISRLRARLSRGAPRAHRAASEHRGPAAVIKSRSGMRRPRDGQKYSEAGHKARRPRGDIRSSDGTLCLLEP